MSDTIGKTVRGVLWVVFRGVLWVVFVVFLVSILWTTALKYAKAEGDGGSAGAPPVVLGETKNLNQHAKACWTLEMAEVALSHIDEAPFPVWLRAFRSFALGTNTCGFGRVTVTYLNVIVDEKGEQRIWYDYDKDEWRIVRARAHFKEPTGDKIIFLLVHEENRIIIPDDYAPASFKAGLDI